MVACRITDARNIAENNRRQTEQRHHLYHQPPSSLQSHLQIPIPIQYQPQHQPQHQPHLQHQQPLILTNNEKNTLDRQILHQQQQPEPQTEQQTIHIRNAGSNSTSQVPLTKYKESRISSLTAVLIAVLHWIWPPDRCTNCHSIYSSPYLSATEDNNSKTTDNTRTVQVSSYETGATLDPLDTNNLEYAEGGVDEVDCKRNSSSSSSDDGGFLSRRNFLAARTSWRRPLIASTSQQSLQSARGLLHSLGGLLKIGGYNQNSDTINAGARYQNVYRSEYGLSIGDDSLYRNMPHLNHGPRTLESNTTDRPLHISTISGSLGNIGHHVHQVFSPTKVSRIFSSSPTNMLNSAVNHSQDSCLSPPWTLASVHNCDTADSFFYNQFNNLSSVYPGSAEHSLPTLTPTPSANNSRQRYYSNELPSLRTIEEETRRMNIEQQQQLQQQQQQVQDQLLMPPPPPPTAALWRSYYQPSTLLPYSYHTYRPRTRWYPRQYTRLLSRPHSELMTPLPHLNLSLRPTHQGTRVGLDVSPESRSSSSGFGSKNTSNHPQGSHHSGSTSEWRLLPPYRPPPPPPLQSEYFGTQPQQAQAQVPVDVGLNGVYAHHSPPSGHFFSSLSHRAVTPPYTMEHWLDMITRLNAATDSVNLSKAIDVGSVDGHYEFDPSTPTPSASSPTGGLLRDDLNLHIDTGGHLNLSAHLNNSHGHYHQHHHYHHTLGPLNTTNNFFHLHNGTVPFSNAGTYASGGEVMSGSGSVGSGHIRKHRMLGAGPRYDNVEARLQAMKDEFYEYRKKQAMRRAGVIELGSVC